MGTGKSVKALTTVQMTAESRTKDKHQLLIQHMFRFSYRRKLIKHVSGHVSTSKYITLNFSQNSPPFSKESDEQCFISSFSVGPSEIVGILKKLKGKKRKTR